LAVGKKTHEKQVCLICSIRGLNVW
jgi:hypothetical protein